MTLRTDIFGWYEDARDQTPTHDPGLSGVCLVCGNPLMASPRVTVSLMKHNDNRSYFYRAHKSCYQENTSAIQEIEWAFIDNLPIPLSSTNKEQPQQTPAP